MHRDPGAKPLVRPEDIAAGTMAVIADADGAEHVVEFGALHVTRGRQMWIIGSRLARSEFEGVGWYVGGRKVTPIAKDEAPRRLAAWARERRTVAALLSDYTKQKGARP